MTDRRSIVRDIIFALDDLIRGKIAEIKIVRTRRGVDILRMTKKHYDNDTLNDAA